MRRRGDQFTPSGASKQGPSPAACIITTFVFDFRQGGVVIIVCRKERGFITIALHHIKTEHPTIELDGAI